MHKPIKLDPHQETLLKEVLEKPRYAILAPPGSGKTLIVLEAIRQSPEIKKVLIIAPRLVITNAWQKEILKWGFSFKTHILRGTGLKKVDSTCDIFITTPESLLSKKMPEVMKCLEIDTLIVDESSKFKNLSKRTKLLMKWSIKFNRCYIMTATAAPRSLENLWPQFFLVDQGDRLERTITHYRKKYFYQVGPYEFNHWVIRPGAEKRIREKIKDVAKSVKIKYQEKFRYIDNELAITRPVAKKLKEIQQNVVIDDLKKSILVVNNTATKLLQISGGACYTDDEPLIFCHQKLDWVRHFVENMQRNPILIACNYSIEIDRILKTLKGYDCKVIQGGMSDKKIETIINQWNKKKLDVLIAQPAAMGHGLNLQYGGNVILWVSAPVDAELYEQFNGRLNRKGQEDATVFVHHLVMENTADQKFFDAIRKKMTVQQALIEYLR